MTDVNYLQPLEPGEKIKASVTNSNNNYLDNRISNTASTLDNRITSMQAGLESGISTLNDTVKANTNSINAINQKAQINAVYLKTTYRNGASGYNIWSNGFCQQWGRMYGSGDNRWVTCYLLKDYGSTDYSLTIGILGTQNNDSVKYWNVGYESKANGSFQAWANPSYQTYKDWQTCGYLPAGTY